MIGAAAINWQRPISTHGLNDGLAAWWLASGPRIGGNRWYDLVGGREATLNSMDPTTDWVPSSRLGGKYGLDFDATNDYVSGPSSILTSNVYTLAAWVYIRAASAYQAIVQIRVSDTDEAMLFTDTSPFFRGGNWSGSAASANPTITLNTWIHVAVTSTGTVTQMYINGLASGTTGTTKFTTLTPSLMIGARAASSFTINGQIDDVRIYNRCLSAPDIALLYGDSLTGYQRTLNRLTRTFAYSSGAAAATGGGAAFNARSFGSGRIFDGRALVA